MTREEALDKIKKLLRMKRGGTKGEVENALAAAQKLAAEHGINLDHVNPDAQSADDHIGHEDTLSAARIQFECKYAGLVCQQFFNVSVFTQRKTWQKISLTFVGTDWDRQIAVYVYHFLVGHFRREWKRRERRLRNRRSFMWGMYIGICSKLREAAGPEKLVENGVLVIDQRLAKRNEYVKKNFGEMEGQSVKPDRDAEAARREGLMAGRRTEIRKGVNGASVPEERRIETPRLQLPAPKPQQMEML